MAHDIVNLEFGKLMQLIGMYNSDSTFQSFLMSRFIEKLGDAKEYGVQNQDDTLTSDIYNEFLMAVLDSKIDEKEKLSICDMLVNHEHFLMQDVDFYLGLLKHHLPSKLSEAL